MYCKSCKQNKTDNTLGLCWKCYQEYTKNWTMLDFFKQHEKDGLVKIEYGKVAGLK